MRCGREINEADAQQPVPRKITVRENANVAPGEELGHAVGRPYVQETKRPKTFHRPKSKSGLQDLIPKLLFCNEVRPKDFNQINSLGLRPQARNTQEPIQEHHQFSKSDFLTRLGSRWLVLESTPSRFPISISAFGNRPGALRRHEIGWQCSAGRE